MSWTWPMQWTSMTEKRLREVCKIHKSGYSIELETTLVDFLDLRWKQHQHLGHRQERKSSQMLTDGVGQRVSLLSALAPRGSRKSSTKWTVFAAQMSIFHEDNNETMTGQYKSDQYTGETETTCRRTKLWWNRWPRMANQQELARMVRSFAGLRCNHRHRPAMALHGTWEEFISLDVAITSLATLKPVVFEAENLKYNRPCRLTVQMFNHEYSFWKYSYILHVKYTIKVINLKLV